MIVPVKYVENLQNNLGYIQHEKPKNKLNKF